MYIGCTTPTEAGRKNYSCEEIPTKELKGRKSLTVFVITYAKRGSTVLVFKEYTTNLGVLSQSCFTAFDKSLLLTALLFICKARILMFPLTFFV